MSSFQGMKIRLINKPGQFMPVKKHIFTYKGHGEDVLWKVVVPAVTKSYSWQEVYLLFKQEYGDSFPMEGPIHLINNVTFSEEMAYD